MPLDGSPGAGSPSAGTRSRKQEYNRRARAKLTPEQAEARREYNRKWNAAHRDGMNAAWRKWRDAHPEALKARQPAKTLRAKLADWAKYRAAEPEQ
jgi:hypothetical protein